MARGLKQEMVGYLQRNVDRTITLDELEEELGHSRGSISSTMSGLCRSKEWPIERLGMGLYRWNTNGRQSQKDQLESGDLMEVLHIGQGGKLLLKDGLGGTWVARKIEIEEL